MNPENHKSVTNDKPPVATDELMQWLINMGTAADLERDRYEYRAARNMRLVKGLPVEDQSIVSNVRKRRKLYFRKIWSAGYRILASFYQAFLQDLNQVKFEGRDEDKDPAAAKVLQKLVEYYRDRLMRTRSLFVQFMWNFLDIIFLGDTNGKLYWKYNEETGDDYLDYKAYPMEQVGRDWAAVIPDEMRFCYFDNYLVKDALEEQGYDETAVKNAAPCSMPTSPLRAVRYFKSSDPMSSPNVNATTNYPESGTGSQPPADQHRQLYRVREFFYRKQNKLYSCVINPEGRVWFKKPTRWLLKHYPLITGSMLLEAHKASGEGIPEVGEGPQESLNYNLNIRKDNVDMALRVRPVYDRDANVDIAALLDHRTGLPIGVDGDVNSAVKFDRPPDVTQSSYMEGNQDIGILDEYYGTNPTKMGNSSADKATVAQINLSEGNAKIDLFIATTAETFFRQWYYVAAELVSVCCTDEKAIRIANEALRREDPKAFGAAGQVIYDLEDLNLDIIVQVGAGTVGRQVQNQLTTNFIGQAIQANQMTALALKAGIQAPGLTFINVTKLLIDQAPQVGIKNVKDYEIPVSPPPQQGDPAAQHAQGTEAPQPNADNGMGDVMSQILPNGGGQ
jgi:hypothetical protein